MLTLSSIMYLIFLIKDTRGPWSDNDHGRDQSSINMLGAFSFYNVIDVFKTCLKRREYYIRSILMLLILTMLFNLSTICKLD